MFLPTSKEGIHHSELRKGGNWEGQSTMDFQPSSRRNCLFRRIDYLGERRVDILCKVEFKEFWSREEARGNQLHCLLQKETMVEEPFLKAWLRSQGKRSTATKPCFTKSCLFLPHSLFMFILSKKHRCFYTPRSTYAFPFPIFFSQHPCEVY